MDSISVLCADPFPTDCLSLQIRSVELALDHTSMSNPPPEAGRLGSSRRVRRGLGRWSGPAKGVWAPHILTHLPASSLIWSKSLGLSGPPSPHGQIRITVPARGLDRLVVNLALLPNSHMTSASLSAFLSFGLFLLCGERCCPPCRVVVHKHLTHSKHSSVNSPPCPSWECL